MQEKANEIKGLETGIIRVGTISSITCHWMPQLIKGFQELYPKVQFLFHQGDYTSIQEWIKTGAVDFGFITPPAVTELETMVIKNGEMLAILPTNHPLATRPAVRLEEI
ncbi:MAG: LysR family transcriptional regulator substrate-binding protein [Lachnospiraceae bacterium]|nr:LysR family transcriptional regulator substrate-binding protein [Lachnospiraceae bacterium]